jgi:hypothetical protein
MVESEYLHDIMDENTHIVKVNITIRYWRNNLVTTFSPFHIFSITIIHFKSLTFFY